MKANYPSYSPNRVSLVDSTGSFTPICLAYAKNITSVPADIAMDEEAPFFIIPLAAGKFSVILASGVPYEIAEAEVTANMGKILPYSVKRILKTGTTASTFNIGY